MRILELTKVPHEVKVGERCVYIEPNIHEDCLLVEDGKPVGLYVRNVNDYDVRMGAVLDVANKEFRSERVPKATLHRTQAIMAATESGRTLKQLGEQGEGVMQYSTLLGSIKPNPRVRRLKPGYASTHRDPKAQTFVKAMIAISQLGMTLLEELSPELHQQQLEAIAPVDDKWRFGKHFTSSISNYNTAAPFHVDTGNIVGSLNFIYTKRSNSQGGCLNVPDYGATFEQPDNSMLVYPAWRNVHGVTPIQPHEQGGYRNSLIVYSLKAFLDA